MTFRSTIPVGTDGEFVQAMSLNEDKAHQITIAASSDRNSVAFDSATRVIEVYSDVDCYLRQGDSSVVATTSDHFFPATFTKIYSIGGDKTAQKTHIAVIQSSGGGTLHISEME